MRMQRLGTALVAGLLAAGPVAGQGVGSVGLEVAQIPLGARAGGLAGAYTAAWGDSDGIFYNPAAVAALSQAASLAYQRHVMDVGFGSAAGAVRVGPVVLGAGFAFMDGGEVAELVPDPDYGGQRGIPTGNTVSARESVFRLAAAAPLLGGRLHAGGALGVGLSELAGVSRSAGFIDLGVQARVLPGGTLGLAVRNLGGSLSGDGAEDADLPLEARLGGSVWLPLRGELGTVLATDLIHRPTEETTGVAGGVEVGLMPADAGVGAVLRLGYRVEEGLPAASALHLGAGVSYAGLGLDYQYQDLEFFGAAHRIGIRWRRQ